MAVQFDSDEFTCGLCGKTFYKGRPDADALAQTAEVFGPVPADDLVVVCEDCYVRMIKADPPDFWQERQAKERSG